jgi:hypothetical protein
MVEGMDPELVNRLAQKLADEVTLALKQQAA